MSNIYELAVLSKTIHAGSFSLQDVQWYVRNVSVGYLFLQHENVKPSLQLLFSHDGRRCFKPSLWLLQGHERLQKDLWHSFLTKEHHVVS